MRDVNPKKESVDSVEQAVEDIFGTVTYESIVDTTYRETMIAYKVIEQIVQRGLEGDSVAELTECVFRRLSPSHHPMLVVWLVRMLGDAVVSKAVLTAEDPSELFSAVMGFYRENATAEMQRLKAKPEKIS